MLLLNRNQGESLYIQGYFPQCMYTDVVNLPLKNVFKNV